MIGRVGADQEVVKRLARIRLEAERGRTGIVVQVVADVQEDRLAGRDGAAA